MHCCRAGGQQGLARRSMRSAPAGARAGLDADGGDAAVGDETSRSTTRRRRVDHRSAVTTTVLAGGRRATCRPKAPQQLNFIEDHPQGHGLTLLAGTEPVETVAASVMAAGPLPRPPAVDPGSSTSTTRCIRPVRPVRPIDERMQAFVQRTRGWGGRGGALRALLQEHGTTRAADGHHGVDPRGSATRGEISLDRLERDDDLRRPRPHPAGGWCSPRIERHARRGARCSGDRALFTRCSTSRPATAPQASRARSSADRGPRGDAAPAASSGPRAKPGAGRRRWG